MRCGGAGEAMRAGLLTATAAARCNGAYSHEGEQCWAPRLRTRGWCQRWRGRAGRAVLEVCRIASKASKGQMGRPAALPASSLLLLRAG